MKRFLWILVLVIPFCLIGLPGCGNSDQGKVEVPTSKAPPPPAPDRKKDVERAQ